MGPSASLGYRVGRSSPTDRSRSVVVVTELVAATAPAVTQSSIAMLSTVPAGRPSCAPTAPPGPTRTVRSSARCRTSGAVAAIGPAVPVSHFEDANGAVRHTAGWLRRVASPSALSVPALLGSVSVTARRRPPRGWRPRLGGVCHGQPPRGASPAWRIRTIVAGNSRITATVAVAKQPPAQRNARAKWG